MWSVDDDMMWSRDNDVIRCEVEIMIWIDDDEWWCDKIWIDDDDVKIFEEEMMWCDMMWSRDDDVIRCEAMMLMWSDVKQWW
jgi:hypothetical protein